MKKSFVGRSGRSGKPGSGGPERSDQPGRGVAPGRSGKPKRDEQVQRGDKAPRSDKPQRGEKTQRNDKPRGEAPQRSGKPQRSDKPRGETPQRSGKPQRSDKPRGEAPQRSGKPQRGDKPHSEKPQRHDKPLRVEKPQRGDKAQRGDKPQRSDKPQRGDRLQRGDKPQRGEKASPFSEQTFFVDGLAAVAEYIRFRPAAICNIRTTPQHQSAVQELLAKHQVTVPVLAREDEPDEGTAPVSARVRLQAMPFDACLSRIKGRQRSVILALDHITDPRNLGAIVRSAAFFGVTEVLVPERRQVLLTQSAVNTAQGGFALCELVVVVNLSRALATLKDDGYWLIGTQMQGEPYQQLAHAYQQTVIVLGAEDTGLSRNVLEACDRLAAIPGVSGGLDSLNVAVAAGIILCEFTRPSLQV